MGFWSDLIKVILRIQTTYIYRHIILSIWLWSFLSEYN